MAGEVRQPIDLKALEGWIDSNVKEIKTPLDLKQFGFGQSNPTYQLTDATGQKFVMRKKPPGQLLSKTAHQVDREFRIIDALGQTDVPVPKAYCLCEDDSIIGTAFYIMEFLDGRFITDPAFPGWSAEDRKAGWRSAIDTLAKFHRVDYEKIGLSSFGRHYGFYDRQIKTFTTISANQAKAEDMDTKKPVGDIPHFHEMTEFFREKQKQPKDRSTLIHGDYKIDNLVFHKTEPRVIGILDWEMATIGHPLSDVVNLSGPWTWTAKSTPAPSKRGSDSQKNEFDDGATPGLPTLQEVVNWYISDSGYDVAPELKWGTAFGAFRNSVIMQGIAARYARRQASGTTAKNYGEQMGPYGEYAFKQVQALQQTSDGKTKAKL